MKLRFLGANRQVTGSRYVLQVNGSKIMIDCGMFQERQFAARNWEPCPVPPSEIHAMLLTHIHIDHSGLIPKYVKDGFNSPIYATRATIDLAPVLLGDSARIQEEDAAYKKKRHRKEQRSGAHPELPLYTQADVERTLPLFQAVEYGQPVEIVKGVVATWFDAGHILGSAMIQIDMEEVGEKNSIIFSADVGQTDKPFIRDPSFFTQADYVVMESTYGNRDHEPLHHVPDRLCKIINDTVDRGGNLVIPTFAVERAQELIYYLSKLVYANRIPDLPIFLDSPMAVDVTEVFRQHCRELDEETQKLINSDQPPLRFPGLRLVRSVQDSKAIKEQPGSSIIMSASGMCNAGRIKHHLRNNISRPESTILFVGYQAEGTLGRLILEGRPFVRIHGQDRKVKARIEKINGLSAHADRTGLIHWLGHLKSKPKCVFLCHGEEEAAFSLAARIREQLGFEIQIPHYDSTFDLDGTQ
jgi:metallo-beta-lactamase family protein